MMNKDFEETIRGKETLVLFYAPWCGFSRRFLPVFEEYSKTCTQDCVIVNREESPELCKKYSVNYYPTVILFKEGKVGKRLDSKPGEGLNKSQFEHFTNEEK